MTKELNLPIPKINPEDLPDTLSNHILRGFVADLTPQPTTPGMDMWAELRFRSTGERNYPRWSNDIAVDGVKHTVALFGVKGLGHDGKPYAHNTLRCSCSLPGHRTFEVLDEEYEGCLATDQVISERVQVYRELIGPQELGSVSRETLLKATVFLLDIAKRDRWAWPPSHRSDRLLVDRIADIYDISRHKVRADIQELAEEELVIIHGETNPSISLAA